MTPLSRQLHEALTHKESLRTPQGIHTPAPGALIAWKELHSGLRQRWGQTYLLLTDESFSALTRGSFGDPWEYLPLAPGSSTEAPEAESGLNLHKYELTLKVTDYTGERHDLLIYDLEKPGLLSFLDALARTADRIQTPAPPAAPEPQPAPAPHISAATPAPETLREEMEVTLDGLDALPDDPTTAYVMEHLERLLFKANEYLHFGTDQDPIERLGRSIEAFFLKQGEKFFMEGSKERSALQRKLEGLKESVSSRLHAPPRALTPNQKHDRDTHVRTGDLLAKREATHARALLSYEKALELDPVAYDALKGALKMALALHEGPKAREYCDRAMKSAPSEEERATIAELQKSLP